MTGIKALIKKNIITIWLLASLILFCGIIAYAAYTNTNYAPKTVTVHEGIGLLFTSNYLDEIKNDDISGTNYPVELAGQGYKEFDILLRNYNISDITSFYKGTIEYKITASLVYSNGSPLEMSGKYIRKANEKGIITIDPDDYILVEPETGTERDYRVLKNKELGDTIVTDDENHVLITGKDGIPFELEKMNFGFYSQNFKHDPSGSITDEIEEVDDVEGNQNLASGNHTVSYKNYFNKKEVNSRVKSIPYDKKYRVRIDITQLNDPNIYVKVVAEPKEKNQEVKTIGRILGLSHASDEVVPSWHGEFVDEAENSKDADGFNYVITGNGTGTGLLIWNASYLDLDKYIRENGYDQTQKMSTHIVESDEDGSEHNLNVKKLSDDIKSRYERDYKLNDVIEEMENANDVIKAYEFSTLGEDVVDIQNDPVNGVVYEEFKTTYKLVFHRKIAVASNESWSSSDENVADKTVLYVGERPVLMFIFKKPS